MKHTKWIWIFLLAILLIGAALLLLQTKANNSYFLFPQEQKDTISPQIPSEGR